MNQDKQPDVHALIERLQCCADDPMWDAHVEMSKSLVLKTIAALQDFTRQPEVSVGAGSGADDKETPAACAAAAHARAEALQAKVDALMLEWCPEEMTPEQVAEWGRNQRPVDAALEAAKPAAVPDVSNLSFVMEKRMGTWVIDWSTKGGLGCRPAMSSEIEMWQLLAASKGNPKPAAVPDYVVETLVGIANADWRNWEEYASLEDFEQWVKSRAQYALTALAASKGNT